MIWLANWLKRLPPPGMLAAMYVIFIALGAAALMLPICTTEDITWSDAIFTSTSAVTVTGLVVVDTGTVYTVVGQMVIAFLIHMGGLGLMTFAVLLLSALGVSIGMPQRMILREDLSQTSMGNLLTLVKIVFAAALLFESVGALLLMFVFVPSHGWLEGLWFSIFHAISAFNNAGFGLLSDSLSQYVTSPLLNIVVPTLFIVSGLGFVVLSDIIHKRSWRPLSLHSKLMLAGTAFLIVFAFVSFAALEWRNPATLGGLDGTLARLQASWFQAVTPRTAGFNTLDTGAYRDATALLTIGLMVIGGGSASTAGGIKVTTAIVLVMGMLAFFRRRVQLSAFGRALGDDEVAKVMALTTVSVIVIFTGLFVLTIVNESDFLILAFEVASAFGTVGMSMGATATLDGWGRGVIITIMFLGRVGPLALGFFLATQHVPRVRYPHGQVYLG